MSNHKLTIIYPRPVIEILYDRISKLYPDDVDELTAIVWESFDIKVIKKMLFDEKCEDFNKIIKCCYSVL